MSDEREFKLRRATNHRLLALIFGPLVTVLFFAVPAIVDRLEYERRATQYNELLQLWRSAVEFVNLLQLERGASVAVLAGSDDYRQTLALNREKTTEHLAKFQKLAHVQLPRLSSLQKLQLEHVIFRESIESVQALRAEFDSQKIALADIFSQYSTHIQQLIDLHELLLSDSLSADYSTLLLGHADVTKMIEAIGQQRALVTYALASNSNIPELVGILYVARAREHLSRGKLSVLERSKSVGFHFTDEQMKANTVADSAVDRILSGHLPSEIGMSAKDWFQFQTARIEDLTHGRTAIFQALQHEIGNQRAWRLMELILFVVVAFVGTVGGVSFGAMIASRLRNVMRKLERMLKVKSAVARKLRWSTGELKEKNQQLASLDAQKNHFIGVLAHDLRNPLTSVTGFADLLVAGKVADPAKQTDYLKRIYLLGEFMRNMVDDLLDIATMNSGKLTLNCTELDLLSLVQQVIWFFETQAEKKGVTIHCELPACVPLVWGDPRRLEQVLQNLLSNALKFSHPKSSIEISFIAKDNDVIIAVEDHGVGMSPEDLNRLFMPFGKLSSRPTGGEKSTGLGLSIVQKIVSEHHGRIWAESSQGQGSSFFVALPSLLAKQEKETLLVDISDELSLA